LFQPSHYKGKGVPFETPVVSSKIGPFAFHATKEINSPRTFLFSFLVFKDFAKADLI
jgi:hypothetical protein